MLLTVCLVLVPMALAAIPLRSWSAAPPARAGAIAEGVAASPSSSVPKPSFIAAPCLARFERARGQLIAGGFAPIGDEDTRRWLRVDTGRSLVLLRLEMRTSADGAATSYTAFVERPRMGLEPKGWRLVRRKYCCDEHASREDRLFEHVWSRSTARLRAVVSVVEFEERLRDPQIVRWRDMFVEAARSAADDCLAPYR
jgi:hypothetical protein